MLRDPVLFFFSTSHQVLSSTEQSMSCLVSLSSSSVIPRGTGHVSCTLLSFSSNQCLKTQKFCEADGFLFCIILFFHYFVGPLDSLSLLLTNLATCWSSPVSSSPLAIWTSTWNFKLEFNLNFLMIKTYSMIHSPLISHSLQYTPQILLRDYSKSVCLCQFLLCNCLCTICLGSILGRKRWGTVCSA